MAAESSTNRTYVFEDDKVFALQNGKVIAAADDVEELEDLKDEESEEETEEPKVEKKTTHIITPSGLKGKIVSRTEGLWSDEVAVRLENGNIAHYPVLADTQFFSEEEEKKGNPIENLEGRLEEDVDESDEDDLKKRKKDLDSIKSEASGLIQKGASYDDVQTLDKIALQAQDEIGHVDDSLAQLEQNKADAYQPAAPFHTEVVPQESMGRGDGKWLDNTLQDMINEAEGHDYNKIMDEGPEQMVAELDSGPLADQGAVQSIAAGFIREKTAGVEPVVRAKYEKTFLARVEEVRRAELANRKTTAKKEASTEKDVNDDAPDESLFF